MIEFDNVQDLKALRIFFPVLILEKVPIEGFLGKSARFEHILCNPAAATTRLKTDHTH